MTIGGFDLESEALAVRGLRNRWWCIGPSTMIEDKPVGLTRLGDKLVAWRDASGKVNLVEDRCPHRAAPLSMARLIDGRLTCRYHGVQVGGDGKVLSVPAYPDCDLVGQKLVKAYPVIEHFQGIWAYFGDDARAEPCPLELPLELASDDWTGFLVSNTWHCNYQYVLDNLCDIMHPPYLHGDTYNLAYGDKSDVIEVKSTDTGVVVRRKNDPASNVNEQEYVDATTCYTRVAVFSPPGNGPGGYLRIIATVVPIDENTCQFNAWRLRKVKGWQGAMFRFMFNMLYEKHVWEIIEQDREMLEGLPPWPPDENLYQHDSGVSRVRHHIRSEAERQVRALAMRAAQIAS
jgi:phenylpropionate dioxygenase-like ring-hydroxylating dioxygenase large terminal subunit